MSQALEGIKVIDLSCGMAGSVATMVLSDFGADVTKIESPEGDPYRVFPSFLHWSRGKKSALLDLENTLDLGRMLKLVELADVLVESFPPGLADHLGIGYEALKTSHPDLVYCSITGFGPKGPYSHYKDYEGLVQAKSGRLMVFEGLANREGPGFSAVNVASHAAAMAAVRGIISALIVRDQTGQGQRVETSLLQALTYYDMNQFVLWQMMINFPETFDFDPITSGSRPSPIHYLPARTKDGQWIQLANLIEGQFRSSMFAIGLGHIYDDQRFANAPEIPDGNDREMLRRMILSRMQEKTLTDWMDFFVREEGNVGAEPFMTASEGLSHPQMIHNGHVQVVHDATVGQMRQLGPAFHMDQTPALVQGPAPALGQHTEEVIQSISKKDRTFTTVGSFQLPPHPLNEVTVLDLSTVIAGPLAGSLVAELGARVIRIETLAGDWMRRHYGGISPNRTMAGTEGLSIDLKTEEGQVILRSLIAKADVLMHNMRPGAPERLGIGFEQVRLLNPEIIYVYVSGYGSTGPYCHRPVFHPIGGAVSGGAMAQAGLEALPPAEAVLTMDEIVEVSRKLGRAQDVNPDPNTSMVASTAIVMGLYARCRTGKPQYIETTLLAANAYANADDFFDYRDKNPRSIADASGYGLNALYRIYEAKIGWVFLACPLESEWPILCAALCRQDLLGDLRFLTAKDRTINDISLISELSLTFKTKEPRDWEKELSARGVGCVRVEDSNMYNFFNDNEHIRENEFTVEVEHQRFGRFWRYSPILNFSKTPCKSGAGILRGQHTMSILQELGYTEKQVHLLRASGVLDWEEVTSRM